MDVLVVGGGGREHALVWALRNSSFIEEIYCAPGNAGIGRIATCWNHPPGDIQGLVTASRDHAVDLVVVGPEAPLTAGLADVLGEHGIPCFGPSRKAAVIEGSKAFAKAFMARHDIPTPAFEVFAEAKNATAFVEDPPWEFPIVVKADGLAAGKGAVICDDSESAVEAVHAAMVERVYGRAGERVVIEEFVEGVEATVMALCDGEEAQPLLPSQDHKTLNEGGEGPNTGGMGAYAPAYQVLGAEQTERVREEILEPTVSGLAEEGREFRGLLYAGLMLTDDGPTVLEFNCRFGDPEAQAVIPLLDEDLAERLMSVAYGEPLGGPLEWSGRACACVIMAAPGYPGNSSPYGLPITGSADAQSMDDVLVFHSGTAMDEGQLVTSGGRVLGVTGIGDDLDAALNTAYRAVDAIQFDGAQVRRDIGRAATEVGK